MSTESASPPPPEQPEKSPPEQPEKSPPEHPEEPEKPKAGGARCPKCGAYLPPKATHCDRCAELQRCLACFARFDADAMACPKCGHPVGVLPVAPGANTAFALGLAGFLLGIIPLLGLIGTAGMFQGLSVLSRHSSRHARTGYAVAGVVLGALATLGVVTWLVVFALIKKGSCPHVQSFDGTSYALDADVLSGALYEGGEGDDMARLDRIRAASGRYRIRIADELEERDALDSVALVVADHPAAVDVLPVQGGEVVGVVNARAPTRAVDGRGRDVLAALVAADGVSFVSRLEDFSSSSAEEPRERLEVELERDAAAGEPVLVLRTRATAFAEDAFAHYLAEMGPGTGWLIHQGEGCVDYPFHARLDDEMRRLGLDLTVSSWDGTRWVQVAEVKPIGPAILRDVAVPLPALAAGSGPVRLRLEHAPGFWEIDRVALGRAADGVATTTVRPDVARDGLGRSVLSELSARDGVRVHLAPGEHVDLEFPEPAHPESGAGRETRTVLVSVRGYYEFDIGGRGVLNPVAVLKHQLGWTSLPRYALERMRHARS